MAHAGSPATQNWPVACVFSCHPPLLHSSRPLLQGAPGARDRADVLQQSLWPDRVHLIVQTKQFPASSIISDRPRRGQEAQEIHQMKAKCKLFKYQGTKSYMMPPWLHILRRKRKYIKKSCCSMAVFALATFYPAIRLLVA
eukprot:1017238-Pelagomonas_calceolata.AAC.1